MTQRKRIQRAVAWTNTQHWEAWNLWDEVIDWGDCVEECSPATPPTVQVGGDKEGLGGVNGENVEVTERGKFEGKSSDVEMTESDMSVMTVLNGGEGNGCKVGVNVEEVKGEGENSTGNVLGCMVSQGGRTLLETIEEEGPEEEEDTDLEAQDADVATAERWQYLAVYIARTWLETSQGEEAKEDEENDVAFQEAEDADVVRLQVMVAHGERLWLETIPEEGAEEVEDTKVTMVDEIKEDAVEKTTGEELSSNVNAEDLSGDGIEKSQKKMKKKKKKKKKMRCAFFCCPFSFWKK